MRIINLDMDGVLANFNGRMKKLTGKAFEEFGVSKDAWKAVGNEIHTIYKELEPLPDAFDLVEEVSKISSKYGYEVAILTGIPKHNRIPFAEQHKRDWIRFYFPEFYSRFKIGPWSEDKWKHCYSNEDILIDDYYKNTEQWIAQGGRAILHRNAKDTIEQLKIIVEMDK